MNRLQGVTLASIESFIYRSSSLLITILVSLLSYMLIPIALLMLARVEIFRVSDGVRLVDPARADNIALALVAMYLLLQVVRSSLLSTEFGTLERPKHSLRHNFRAGWYFLGLPSPKGWQEQFTTPLERLEKAKASIGVVIVVLGTLGSMHARLATLDGTWYNALWSIASESTLLDFLTYFGGFAITAALLSALDWLIPYTFQLHNSRNRPELEITPLYSDFFALPQLNNQPVTKLDN